MFLPTVCILRPIVSAFNSHRIASHSIFSHCTVLYREMLHDFVLPRIVSISTVRVFLRSSFLGWPGFARTTAAARPVCWRSSGPPSSSLAWTAPFPVTPTSTSTSCRPWPTSSTSTAKTWWWPPSPLLTTGREAGQPPSFGWEPKGCEIGSARK